MNAKRIQSQPLQSPQRLQIQQQRQQQQQLTPYERYHPPIATSSVPSTSLPLTSPLQQPQIVGSAASVIPPEPQFRVLDGPSNIPQYHHHQRQSQILHHHNFNRPTRPTSVHHNRDAARRLNVRFGDIEFELHRAMRVVDAMSGQYLMMWDKLERLELILYEQQTMMTRLLAVIRENSETNSNNHFYTLMSDTRESLEQYYEHLLQESSDLISQYVPPQETNYQVDDYDDNMLESSFSIGNHYIHGPSYDRLTSNFIPQDSIESLENENMIDQLFQEEVEGSPPPPPPSPLPTFSPLLMPSPSRPSATSTIISSNKSAINAQSNVVSSNASINKPTVVTNPLISSSTTVTATSRNMPPQFSNYNDVLDPGESTRKKINKRTRASAKRAWPESQTKSREVVSKALQQAREEESNISKNIKGSKIGEMKYTTSSIEGEQRSIIEFLKDVTEKEDEQKQEMNKKDKLRTSIKMKENKNNNDAEESIENLDQDLQLLEDVPIDELDVLKSPTSGTSSRADNRSRTSMTDMYTSSEYLNYRDASRTPCVTGSDIEELDKLSANLEKACRLPTNIRGGKVFLVMNQSSELREDGKKDDIVSHGEEAIMTKEEEEEKKSYTNEKSYVQIDDIPINKCSKAYMSSQKWLRDDGHDYCYATSDADLLINMQSSSPKARTSTQKIQVYEQPEILKSETQSKSKLSIDKEILSTNHLSSSTSPSSSTFFQANEPSITSTQVVVGNNLAQTLVGSLETSNKVTKSPESPERTSSSLICIKPEALSLPATATPNISSSSSPSASSSPLPPESLLSTSLTASHSVKTYLYAKCSSLFKDKFINNPKSISSQQCGRKPSSQVSTHLRCDNSLSDNKFSNKSIDYSYDKNEYENEAATDDKIIHPIITKTKTLSKHSTLSSSFIASPSPSFSINAQNDTKTSSVNRKNEQQQKQEKKLIENNHNLNSVCPSSTIFSNYVQSTEQRVNKMGKNIALSDQDGKREEEEEDENINKKSMTSLFRKEMQKDKDADEKTESSLYLDDNRNNLSITLISQQKKENDPINGDENEDASRIINKSNVKSSSFHSHKDDNNKTAVNVVSMHVNKVDNVYHSSETRLQNKGEVLSSSNLQEETKPLTSDTQATKINSTNLPESVKLNSAIINESTEHVHLESNNDNKSVTSKHKIDPASSFSSSSAGGGGGFRNRFASIMKQKVEERRHGNLSSLGSTETSICDDIGKEETSTTSLVKTLSEDNKSSSKTKWKAAVVSVFTQFIL